MNVRDENHVLLQAENDRLRQRVAALEQQVADLTTDLVRAREQYGSSSTQHTPPDEKSKNGSHSPFPAPPPTGPLPYHDIFHSLPIPLMIFRSDGLVVAMNRQNEALMNIPSEHIVGTVNILNNPEMLTHRNVEHLMRAWRGEVVRMSPTSYETPWAYQPDDTTSPPRWTETTYFPICDSTGTIGYVGEMNRDMTTSSHVEHTRDSGIECMQMVMQTMPVLFYALDEHRNIVVWNRECERVTGYQADELGDEAHLLEMLYSTPAERATIQEHLHGSDYHYRDWEWQIRCKDGSLRTIFWSNMTEHSSMPGWVTWVVGMDTTEHKRIEQEVRLFHTLVENAPDGIAVATIDGTITYANAAFCAMVGHDDGLIGLSMMDCCAEERGDVMAHIHHTIRQRSWQGVLTYRRGDGQTFQGEVSSLAMHDTQGRLEAVAWIVRDMSEHLELEAALRRAYTDLETQINERTGELYQANQALQAEIAEHLWTEKLLFDREAMNRTILDSMPALISYVDKSLRYQFANKQYETWFGASRDTIRRKHIADVVGEASYARFRRHIALALEGHEVTHEFLMTITDGADRYVRSSYIPHISGTGQVLGAFMMIHDMSERKQMEEALRESETRYRAISELITDFAYAIRVEADGSLVSEWMTEASARITGFLPEEIARIGGWKRIVYPEDLPTIMHIQGQVLNGNHNVSEFRIITRSGNIRWIRSHAQPVWDENEKRVVRVYGGAKDITEHKEAEERIQSQLQRLSALRQIDMAITTSLDLSLILNVLLNQLTIHLHVDAAAVLLLNAKTQNLEYAAGRGFQSDEIEEVSARLLHNHEHGINAHCDRTTVLEAEGFSTYYSIPLIAKGQIKGVMEIFQREVFTPDHEWLNFLGMLAAQAAIAIDNAELFENLQHSKEELVMAYDETIEGWARALEMRDAETEGHSRRVTEMTMKLARAMGFDDEQLIHIRRGAILHDIGKLAIPDSILLKGDTLTDEEWCVMQQHPVYAYKWLAPIRYLKPALDIPYHHHERWNGNGYPLGLNGEEIPLAARIFAVVDIWDALCSDRPYRNGWPEERVLDYLREQAGISLDPQVVATFLHLRNIEREGEGRSS